MNSLQATDEPLKEVSSVEVEAYRIANYRCLEMVMQTRDCWLKIGMKQETIHDKLESMLKDMWESTKALAQEKNNEARKQTGTAGNEVRTAALRAATAPPGPGGLGVYFLLYRSTWRSPP